MEKLVAWPGGRQVKLRQRGRAAGEPRKIDLLDASLYIEGQVDGKDG
jgi:hypothetical protein